MSQKICLFFLILSALLFANTNAFCISKEITIKGNVKNNTLGFWEFGLSSFYDQEVISIKIDKNGNFTKTIAVTAPQDMFIQIGEGISFFVVPGDKLILEWDNNNVHSTFKITSNSLERQHEINLVYKTSLKYREAFSKLFTDMRSKELTADEKFDKVNSVFKSHIVDILRSGEPTVYAEKIIADVYFNYSINFLEDLNEKSSDKRYLLPMDELLEQTAWKHFRSIDTLLNNERLFRSSNLYRVFVVNKVRSFKPSSYVFKVSASGQYDTSVRYAIAGLELIHSKTMLDWYLTHSLLSSYQLYDFENAERAYQLYADKVTDPVFSDTLKRFHANISRLRPGTPAPH